MPEFSDTFISLFQKRAATEQGGLLSGKDPSAFNPADPLRVWIMCTASLLFLVLRKIHQPKVIAEVLGGILLGPTAFSRIPGFTQHIFPLESCPYLSLVANIGLCLFLFLIGLEIDSGIIKCNARLSATVALAGMIPPFGIGAGLSKALYKEFIDPNIKFTHFMLFTGVAYSITAFPVLCRILTELKLLDTTVGIVVLSAGVGNDIVGWTLLALSVALVNAGSGLTALYIILTCIGWTVFLLLPIKLALKWLARKTGSIETGSSVFFMTVTMMVLFGSAFFTDVIGVHAIFGPFLTGLIVPREGGLAISMTEKLEDMVATTFLPLYFTLSGLSTDLGLLNNGVTWAYTIAIIFTAFVGKFGGCAFVAKYFAGFNWRESGTIGSLMGCKGLVELIVPNVGLSAGILSQLNGCFYRVFSMFVLEALVLTFMTTPLVTWLYPLHLRRRISASGVNFSNIPDDEAVTRSQRITNSEDLKTRFTVVLDKLEHLPGMMDLTQLIQPSLSEPRSPYIQRDPFNEISDTLLLTNPMLSIFRMFGHLNGIRVSPALSVVKFDDLAYSVAEDAKNHNSDMILIPWLPPAYTPDSNHPPTSPVDGHQLLALPITPNPTTATNNTASGGGMSGSNGGDISNFISLIHSQFVRGVFSRSKTDVALFVDQSTLDLTSIVGGSSGGLGALQQHIFFPFFGGPDDRLALDFVVRICANPRVKGTVVRVTKCDDSGEACAGILTPVEGLDPKNMEEINRLMVGSRTAGLPDTIYGQQNTEIRLESDTADNLAWARYVPVSVSDTKSRHSTPSGSFQPHVEFKHLVVPTPLHSAIQEATALVVVTGCSRPLAVENHRAELRMLTDAHGHVGVEVRKAIGDVATAFAVAGVGSGVVVVQAAAAL
ncbi:hypothetical protein BYT27DRAFT_7227327 [Phlegmacium glaucopus]|nr:hypothetical protein BYT27DRAFT_7227327 [Phlegmacium glaucopus]